MRPQYLCGVLRLDGQDHQRRLLDGSIVVAGRAHGELALQRCARGRLRLADAQLLRRLPLTQQAADQGARHVAAADEGDARWGSLFISSILAKRRLISRPK